MNDVREIPGYEGYFCDRVGNIYSTKCGPMRMMKKKVTTVGYESIQLMKRPTEARHPLVHRLILEAWVGPANGLHCNHKNGIRTDNSLSNLEWVTRSENERHARANLGKLIHGHHHPCAKLTDELVVSIRRLRKDGWTYQSLADHFGIGLSHAARVANGHVWKHVP